MITIFLVATAALLSLGIFGASGILFWILVVLVAVLVV